MHRLRVGRRQSGQERHQARVSAEEAEQVFAHQPLLVQADVKHWQTEPRLCAWGRTAAGRRLSLVFTLRGNKIRVISVRPMSRKERTLYARQS